jgi:chromosome segregation ATPase
MATGPAQSQPAALSTHAAVKVQRQLIRGEAEVKRLERDVHQQESDSQRASERLQQQDQTIAELQKQLQTLRPSQSGGQH